jgi:hypothetical protein
MRIVLAFPIEPTEKPSIAVLALTSTKFQTSSSNCNLRPWMTLQIPFLMQAAAVSLSKRGAIRVGRSEGKLAQQRYGKALPCI